MRAFSKICEKLSRILCVCSASGMVVMMLLITLDIIMRTVLKQPIIGAFEISQYLMCIILFGGYAYCQSRHEFLHVTMFIRKLPQKICCIVWAFASFFSVAMGSCLAYACWVESMHVMSVGAVSALLLIPKYPLYYFAGIAMLGFVLALLVDGIKAVIAIFNKEYAEEILSEWV